MMMKMMRIRLFHLQLLVIGFHACECDNSVQHPMMTKSQDIGIILSLVHDDDDDDDAGVLPPGHHTSDHVYRKGKYDG